ELALLAFAGGAAHLELLALAVHRLRHVGVVHALEQARREVDGVGAVALRLLARLAGGALVARLDHDPEIGPGLGVVEGPEDIAGLDVIAVAHTQLADDAAGRVLHLLDVGIDHELPGRDHRAGELGGRRPAAEPDHQQDRGDHDGDDVPVERLLEERHAHYDAPGSVTTRSPGPGWDAIAGGRRVTLLRTSSLGPLSCALPCAMTITRSTAASARGRWAMTMTMPPRARTPRIALVSASSPSLSRFELGSSSTTRNGLRYSARASAILWHWPAESE